MNKSQIQISKECFEQLKQIAAKMAGQDTASTENPIYAVQARQYGAWVDVNWYFSKEAAENYIANARHLHKGLLRLFVKSAHRNHEWRTVFNFLEELAESNSDNPTQKESSSTNQKENDWEKIKLEGNNWIAVSDHLPELNTPVWAGYFNETTGKFEYGIYARVPFRPDAEHKWLWAACLDNRSSEAFGDWDLDDDYSHFTHWHPLPEPPTISKP